MNNCTLFQTRCTGWVEDCSGFSYAFSWFRLARDSRFWLVIGHGPFTKSGTAVTDDFGDLVEVSA